MQIRASWSWRFGAVALLVLVGWYFRTDGYFTNVISFWGDEAIWASRLQRGLYLEGHALRPVGYMSLMDLVARVHSTEVSLRILSYLAGMASLPLIYWLTKRITQSTAAAAVTLGLVAFHPVAVDLSKEFKPYALELLLQAAAIALTLWFVHRPGWRRLSVTLGVLTAAIVFSHSIIFALPGVMLVIAHSAWQRRHWRWLVAQGVCCAAILGGLIAMYLLLWSTETRESSKIFWGEKYDIFYVGNSTSGLARWLLGKYHDVAVWPVYARGLPTGALFRVLQSALFGLHLLGLIAMVARRRWTHLALLVLPLALVLLFNIAGKWPFGPFRTNLFLLLYSAVIPAVGIAEVMQLAKRVRWPVVRPALAAALVAAFVVVRLPSDVHAYATKRTHSDARAMLLELGAIARGRAKCEEPDVLMAEWCSFETLRYYSRYHDEFKRDYMTAFELPRERVRCPDYLLVQAHSPEYVAGRLDKLGLDGQRVFVVTARFHDGWRGVIAAGWHLPPGWAVVGETKFERGRLWELARTEP